MSDEQLCDCGHPISYHHGKPNVCGFCPPHSDIRCRCSAVTTTGVPRLEVYNQRDPSWKPWKGWPGPVLP